MKLIDNYDGGLTCAVNVMDIQAAMRWYQEVLGFELLYYLEELGWAEMKSPVAGVNVGLSQVENMPPPGGNAVLTWGVKDIVQAKSALDRHGVRFDRDVRTIYPFCMGRNVEQAQRRIYSGLVLDHGRQAFPNNVFGRRIYQQHLHLKHLN